MKKEFVSVIVVNWNGKEYLGPCLSSLLAQTYPYYEIILVDNGSTDGSVAYVQQRFPEVRIIANATNTGFAAANNIAIRATSGEYVATLNNDAVVHPCWLEELVASAKADEGVGMVASKILFHHRKDMIDSAGITVDKAGIAWSLQHGERDDGRAEDQMEVFGACAAAALYRRAMLEDVGLFDEDFFAYHEDVDLAWRARLLGWRCLYNPRAIVYHIHSATGTEGSPFKNYLLGRNKVWTVAKNCPAPELFFYLPIIISYDLAAVLYHLAKGDVSPLKGRVAGLAGLLKMLRKRREIQARRRVRSLALAGLISPLEILRRQQRHQGLVMGGKATSRG